MQHPCGDSAESENQHTTRHHDFGGPASPSALYGQRAQHGTKTKATEQEPIAQRTFANAVGHGRQQRQKRAGEEHTYT